ncbi:MAG: arginine--tRNA ligase, partial [Aggregatilineales bacterium]
IAEAIVKHLPDAEFLTSAEIAGPGYINFRLDEDYLKKQVDEILQEGDALFMLDIGDGKKAQVEFVSANPSGPITVGRSRGGILGDTMARLLAAGGYEVQREYYFNNAGVQMINLGNTLKIRYLQALGHDVTIPDADDKAFYHGDYMIDYAKELIEEKSDSLVDADWQPFKEFAEAKNFGWIRDTLAKVDIQHDNFFNEDSLFTENAVWDTLEELENKGYIYQASEWDGASDEEKAAAVDKDPAKWFRSSQFGDEKDRVVVKSNDIPTYTLPDIAYHRNKIERGFDVMVNVLGADHGQQYKVVQMGIEALGLDPSGIHVIINQMVRTVRANPETGKQEEVKISTRSGVYDTLDDLIDMTSADAIRYHMLARSPNSHLSFNVEEVVKQSNENPVYYIQNAHVRCCGIMREAEARNFNDDGADLSLLGDDELAFIRKAMELGDVIKMSIETYEPHRIAFYAQELAGTFHPIY